MAKTDYRKKITDALVAEIKKAAEFMEPEQFVSIAGELWNIHAATDEVIDKIRGIAEEWCEDEGWEYEE